MKNLQYLLIVLGILTSCGSKEEKERIVEVERIVKEHNDSNTVEIPQDVDLGKDLKGSFPKELEGTLCQLFNDDQVNNPFKLEKYFSENGMRWATSTFNSLNGKIDCLKVKPLIGDFPIKVMAIETQLGIDLILALHFDQNSKISSISMLFEKGLTAKREMVTMSDGKKLGTFFIGNPNEKKQTLYVRTPYFHSQSTTYIQYFQYFSRLNMNMVVQENRGAHLSEGTFRWLHRENIKDGGDSVNWITKQPFNNGKVLVWGISYDGFNALATAASNAEGIIGTIACSAPANVATDSFTGSKKMQSPLLNYVWEREEDFELKHFYSKVSYVLDNHDDGMENLDKYVFGREVADWRDYSSSLRNGNDTYWTERNLYKDLLKIKKPVLHIAGLDNDQDGRDTLLAYQYLKNNLSDLSLHKLYLHSEGHGCGQFLSTNDFDNFAAEKFDEVASVTAYSEIKGSDIELPEYTGTLHSYSDFTLDFGGDGAIPMGEGEAQFLMDGAIYDNAGLPNSQGADGTWASITVEEDIIINGMPKVTIPVMNYTLLGFLNISISIMRPDGSFYQVHNDLGSSSRSGYAFDVNESGKEVEVKIDLQPFKHRVTKGSTIFVQVSTQANWALDFFKKERQQYYTQQGQNGYMIFLGGEKSTVLSLPLEKAENLDI